LAAALPAAAARQWQHGGSSAVAAAVAAARHLYACGSLARKRWKNQWSSIVIQMPLQPPIGIGEFSNNHNQSSVEFISTHVLFQEDIYQ